MIKREHGWVILFRNGTTTNYPYGKLPFEGRDQWDVIDLAELATTSQEEDMSERSRSLISDTRSDGHTTALVQEVEELLTAIELTLDKLPNEVVVAAFKLQRTIGAYQAVQAG